MANPKGIGGFKKGQSGNKGGRPKTLAEMQEFARAHTREAVKALVEVAKTGPPAARVAAASALLDRAWGKPPQALEHSGVDGKALCIYVEGIEPAAL